MARRGLRSAIFGFYVALWVLSHLLIYASRQAGAPSFNATSVVLLTESVKLLLALGLLLLAMLTMDGDDISGCARGGCDGGGRAVRGAGGGGSGGEDEAARCKLEGCGIGGADGCGDGGSGTGDCGGGRGGATCRNSISARSSSRCGLVKHAASLTIARRSCA